MPVKSSVLLGVLLFSVLVASPSFAFPIVIETTEFFATSGRTLVDLDGDGVFESQGSDTASSLVASSAPTGLDGREVQTVARGALAFDISSLSDIRFPRLQVLSASLSLRFFLAGDFLVNFPFRAPATLELHGLSDDGALSAADVLVNNRLSTFSAFSEPGRADDQTVSIDVTRFVESRLREDAFLPTFTVRVNDDYELPRKVSTFFGSDDLDPNGAPIDLARLVIRVVRVPEPSSWALLGAGLPGLVVLRRKRIARPGSA